MPHHNPALLGGPEPVAPPETTSENVGQSALRAAAFCKFVAGGIGSVKAESTAVGALAGRSTDTGRAEAGVTVLLCRGARGSN